MKRFYKTAGIAREGDGFAVQLDGRPIRTPARRLMAMPTEALARLVADEWDAQGEDVDRMAMPLNRMCGTAIDDLAGKRAGTVRAIAAYGETDMICYWADDPQKLVEKQQATWRPLLDWAEQRFDLRLQAAASVLPIAQPPGTVQRLHRIADTYDNFRLVGLSVAAGNAASVVIGLALVERRLSGAEAFEAAQLDESFQIAEWGLDDEAEHRRATQKAEFESVERLIAAL